jgi:hypothetical protein
MGNRGNPTVQALLCPERGSGYIVIVIVQRACGAPGRPLVRRIQQPSLAAGTGISPCTLVEGCVARLTAAAIAIRVTNFLASERLVCRLNCLRRTDGKVAIV